MLAGAGMRHDGRSLSNWLSRESHHSRYRSFVSDGIDFDLAVHHHAGNDGGSSRRVFAEALSKHLIEDLEIPRIIEPDSATYQVFRTIACFFEDSQNIANCLMSLSYDIAFHESAIQHRHLTGNVKPPVSLHCTRKW